VIVVDTSAVLTALVASQPDEALLGRIEDEELHVPHLIDVEALHALRRMVKTGLLDEWRAVEVQKDFADLALLRYPHHRLADRIWELRHTLTAYGAAFVALSEVLGAPLVTCDRRLASASGHGAAVEVFGAA